MAPLVVAASAAAAGYYFYGSANAAENRKKAAKWASEFKGEISRGVKKLPRVDKHTVLSLIDTASDSYEKMRSIRSDDIAKAAGELRDNWQRLVSEARAGTGKKTKRKVNPAATKATRSRKR